MRGFVSSLAGAAVSDCAVRAAADLFTASETHECGYCFLARKPIIKVHDFENKLNSEQSNPYD